MGPGRISGDGSVAHRRAPVVLGNFTTRLRVWLSLGGGRLLGSISALRLTRTLRGRSVSGVPCDFYSGARAGIAGLVAPTQHGDGFLQQPANRPPTTLGSFPLRDSVDDSVQRHVARDPGHVSNFPGRTTALRGDAKGGDRDHLRLWRNLRRHGYRLSLAKMGPASLDYLDRSVRDPPDSRLGFFAELFLTCDWRFRDAIHGARGVGCCAGAPK